MQAGECIGLASLCSDELPDTEVTFHGGAVILVIPRYLLEDLIIDDAALSCNIIAALAQKVRFLNAKIAGYTAVRSDEKLYLHLLSLPKDSEGWVEIGESMSSLARRLGIGRASLYRAIDTLIEEETIVRQGQKYRILSFKNKEDESL
jgi:CRP-like cAMP-binding protein